MTTTDALGGNGVIVDPLSDKEGWEDLVASSPRGTFLHTLKWKRILEASFPLVPMYAVIRDSNPM